jgi:pimeloyl-ACP methyl ester carboxylesterase
MPELAFYSNSQRIPLNALLWHPKGPRRTIAILTPGGYGGFSGPHDFRPTAVALNELGIGFAMLNMRTTYGFTDPRLEDAIVDIAAGVAEAKHSGYTDLIMLGCSLGGPRTTLYVTHSDEPAIKAVGYINAIPSPYEEAQVRQNADERSRLDSSLADAQQLIAAGKGEQVIQFPRWFADGRGLTMSARGFINVYGSPSMTDISLLKHAPKVKVPVGVIHGTADHISLPANAQTIYDAFVNAPSRELLWLEGGDHYWGPGPQANAFGIEIAKWVSKVASAR